MTAGEIIYLIVGTVLIIAAAYYTTYFIGSRKARGMAGRKIKVYEQFSLSKDRAICIIGVDEKAYLVVITNAGAELLDTFDAALFEGGEPGFAESAAGLAKRGFRANLEAMKGGFTARVKGSGGDFEESLRRASTDDLIKTYAAEEAEEEPVISIAQKEDGIDEVYRRIQNRRASPPPSGEKEGDGHD